MSDINPPPEAQRFGRSQTPESPRPVHIPEPANIPVLLNQMDPVFNDTTTYNIPSNQTFPPFPEPMSEDVAKSTGVDEQNAVQDFFREAEHQAAAEPEPSVNNIQDAFNTVQHNSAESTSLSSVPSSEHPIANIEQGQQVQVPSTQPNLSTYPETAAANATEKSLETPLVVLHNTENNPHTAGVTEQPQQNDQSNALSAHEVDGGVDYQSLLDTITQSASTAPSAAALTATTAVTSNNEEIARSLPSIPGLPPKPPPRDHPIEFPTYNTYADASTKPQGSEAVGGNLSAASIQTSTDDQQQLANEQTNAPNAVGPPFSSLPSFPGFPPIASSQAAQMPMMHDQMAPGQNVGRSQDPLERPWTPRTQSLYDQFLEDERRYVTEGIWDKFPLGSRLFVGNLPSEKVTKRDLFHKFHKHGRLAQISIKQAYGFVQFLEAASCSAALNAEQGVEIRGRKVHLEISKPQKNTRAVGGGGGAGSGGNGNKNQQRRRSRSPDRGSRRDNRNYSDFRDEPGRRRDDFRHRRSPSPRPYRSRDDYRLGARDGRSRSPVYGTNFSPAAISALDDEAVLQLPRRDPRQVPDVQLLVLEPEVVQSFINWVEQGFRNKGLQAATIWVHNRFPLPAVVKRQIIEGVQAVVKLTRATQNNSKIPLQVFDRSGGASNVNFNEYVDLDVSVAADVVMQARQRERSFQPAVYSPQSYQQPHMTFGAPQPHSPYGQSPTIQYAQQQPIQSQQYPFPHPQQGAYRSSTQPLTPTGQPPNLQQLLANLRQPSTPNGMQNLTATAQNNQNANLSGILGNMNAHQHQQYAQGQSVPYGQYAGSNPSQSNGQQPPNVQNIMEQLARYQR